MKQIRPSFIRSALALVMVTILVGCGQGAPTSANSSKPPLTKITAGMTYVPNIQFAPFYVGVEKGFFTDEGLDVTIRHHGQSEPLFGALQNDTEQVIYAGGAEMLQARSQGINVVNFASMYQHYPVVVIVPEGSPIKTVADLKGRSIGLPGEYGENWFGLLLMLKKAGLTREDVKIQSIGWTAQAALPAGRVDAVIGFSNNDVVQFAGAGYPVRSIPLVSGEVPLVSVGLGTMEETFSRRKDDIVRLKRAIVKATEYVSEHIDESVSLSAKYVPNLSGDEQVAAAKATLKATVALYGTGDEIGRQNPDRWQTTAELLNGAGLLGSGLDPETVYRSLS